MSQDSVLDTYEDPLGPDSKIAIVGMACRLLGADTPDAFWHNLRDGLETLTELSDAELLAAGVTREELDNPNYVRRMPVIENIEDFDPRFFGYTPLEATIMDPQHRLFLECAWEACEQAGYDPAAYDHPIGVFTGAKTNTYLFNVVAQRAKFPGLDNFQIALGNDLSSMATRVSYKLDLRGPSYALHTACSTSLVAIHLACQSLLLDECRMALAGGAAINVPQAKGYNYQLGGILSPDGSCRTFDADAAGSNFGNGGGALLLKRLDDALADGDSIYAVIRGSATNNDGARKASFTAPGVEGQAAVLMEAMACAEVEAEDVSYIEAHGTATDLGDSIEMLALNQAFSASSDKDASEQEASCSIGSAKTNLGHLETAAGVAGMIKTAQALRHREMPPSLNFSAPNPKIDFGAFEVNTELRDWPAPAPGKKRIAGVSSFGIGSTNSHVILEEPPQLPATDEAQAWQVLPLSARNEQALTEVAERLHAHLDTHEDANLADVAYTLGVGRRGFEERRVIVAKDRDGALAALAGEQGPSGTADLADRPVAFLFPGLGEQSVDMGLGLLQREPVFKAEVERCCDLLQPHLGVDLREVIYPRGLDAAEKAGGLDLKALLGRAEKTADASEERLSRTEVAQPAIFVIEYALARLFMARGVTPKAMIGYSLGEYVCATLAGVLELEDVLRLVAERARLIGTLERGSMTAVPLTEKELAPHLEGHGLSLAAVNGTNGCVAAGTPDAVQALEDALAEQDVACRRLVTTHAFHSHLMEPLAEQVTELASGFELKAPSIPYVSNVTGTWIKDEEAQDPSYWARHMCRPVRFADGIGELLRDHAERALVEVGPGNSLTSLTRLHGDCAKEKIVVSALGSRHGGNGAAAAFYTALGTLWSRGVDVDWSSVYEGQNRRRVHLPTYPFQRERCWIEPDLATLARTAGRELPEADAAPLKIDDVDRWLYDTVWNETPWPEVADRVDGVWVLMAPPRRHSEGDMEGVVDVTAELGRQLRERGAVTVRLDAGFGFAESAGEEGERRFTVKPGQKDDYKKVFAAVAELGPVQRVVHLRHLSPAQEDAHSEGNHSEDNHSEDGFRRAQELGLYDLIALTQGLMATAKRGKDLEITVLTAGVHDVTGEEALCPERSTVLAPCVVIPQEHPQLVCRAVDLETTVFEPSAGEELVGRLLLELFADAEDGVVVHRGDGRSVRAFESTEMPASVVGPDAETNTPFRQGGVYLITGGMGGIGLSVCDHLARDYGAKLVLTRRSELPAESEWQAWLDADAAKSEDARDGRTAEMVRRLMALKEAGAEVLAVAADVADEEAMNRVIDATVERFGALHGVIHAAGVLAPDSFKTVQLTEGPEIELHYGPKAYGLYALERALDRGREKHGLELDFCTLYSSLSAVLGGLGYVGYAAANLFMDYFAARHNRFVAQDGGVEGESVRWQSIDWDSWHYEEDESARGGLGTTLSELAMTPSEGFDVLARLLTVDPSRKLVISTGELQPRLDQWVDLRRLRAAMEAESGTAGATRTRQAAKKRSGGEDAEERITEIWRQILGKEDIGPEENFFDLGGNSLLGLQMVAKLGSEFGVEIEPVALFESPTVAAMARYLSPEIADEAPLIRQKRRRAESSDIAIIGLEGRFPGAPDLDVFWDNLVEGRQSTSYFTDEELRESGVDDKTFADPKYVKARPILENVDQFDAPFFGYTAREAEIMDPQHRLFLEAAWTAFENAGYDIQNYDGPVGVYAGASISSYMANIYANAELVDSVGTFQTLIGNEKDSLTTKVSYKLNLRGPSLAVQTFCSTSLVATHLACQALVAGECDMALAGGISVIVPQKTGYSYEQGGIGSVDGQIRAFDAKGSGIVFGNGVGAVVMKRLDDALADGDPIRAVIKATAINNDGSGKAGYSATSVEGQSEVVSAALDVADIHPDSIGYMEAHGTGTPLGDPIEMASLDKAFRAHTERKSFCPIGSAKTNVGHLDRAAGVTGLIKTVLALDKEVIPPSLNFDEPNPSIDFENSAFYVVTDKTEWPRAEEPRRAGVNSLGLGGTNAHAVLEEAPLVAPSDVGAPWQLLTLSAATGSALDRMTDNLAEHLRNHPDQNLADVAYTLQIGRKAMAHRRVVAVRDGEHGEAAELLAARTPQRVAGAVAPAKTAPVVFLLPGLGGQYVGMAKGLYEQDAAFRAAFDQVADLLQEELDQDLRDLLWSSDDASEGASGDGKLDLRRMLGRAKAEASPLDDTAVAQPTLFAVEYALAQSVLARGIRPDAMIGYSLGEYTAACLSGMMSLEDTVRVVARRARLIHGLEAGAMLAVPLAEDAAAAYLGDELSLATLNGPEQTVIAGPVPAVEALEARLSEEGIEHRRLRTTHAFHSAMMDAIHDDVVALLDDVELKAPELPFLSNVTGTWMDEATATDKTYWARHMCRPVRFSNGVEQLLGRYAGKGGAVLLELGPGQTLGSLVLQHPVCDTAGRPPVVAALRSDYESQDDLAYLLTTLGRLWSHGAELDWRAFYGDERRLRVNLPTYSFDRRSYWVDTPHAGGYASVAQKRAGHVSDDGLVYAPTWQRGRAPKALGPAALKDLVERKPSWLLAVDAEDAVSEVLAKTLRDAGATVSRVIAGESFEVHDGDTWTVRPGAAEDLTALTAQLPTVPQVLVQMWNDTDLADFLLLMEGVSTLKEESTEGPLEVFVVTRAACEVTGTEGANPGAAGLLAAALTPRREADDAVCRVVDWVPSAQDERKPARLAQRLLAEIHRAGDEALVAYRGTHLWLPTFTAPDLDPAPSLLAGDGFVCLVGGLAGRGYAWASHLIRTFGDADASLHLLLVDPAATADNEDARTRRLRSLQSAAEGVGVEVQTLTWNGESVDLVSALSEAGRAWGVLRGLIYAADPVALEATLRDAATAGPEAVLRAGRTLTETVRTDLELLDSAVETVAEDLAADLAADLGGAFAAELETVLAVLPTASYLGAAGGDTAKRFVGLFEAAVGRTVEAFAATSDLPWTPTAWDFRACEITDDARSPSLAGTEDPVAQLRIQSYQSIALEQVLRAVPAPQLLATDGRLKAWNRLSVPQASGAESHAAEPVVGGLYPRPELSTTYLEPRNEAETALAGIWEAMLGVQPVGVHDAFLELGGDSLLAARMAARVREVFDIELTPGAFFQAGTIEKLAGVVAEAQAEAAQEAAADEPSEEDVAELMAMIDAMDEDELAAELAKRD